jgi:hypothetical protein
MSYGRYTKKSMFAFFAPLKSSFVCNLITATEYQHCQMKMTRLSIAFCPFSLSLSLSFFLSLSFSLFLPLLISFGVKFVSVGHSIILIISLPFSLSLSLSHYKFDQAEINNVNQIT